MPELSSHGSCLQNSRPRSLRLFVLTSCIASSISPLVRAQTWRRWAGHQVASAYEPLPDREYAAVRGSAALFDVSPLHQRRQGASRRERPI